MYKYLEYNPLEFSFNIFGRSIQYEIAIGKFKDYSKTHMYHIIFFIVQRLYSCKMWVYVQFILYM